MPRDLHPTLAAARAGKTILLANKEALVIGGAAFMNAVREGGATLLPIDSEHNAIFQCLPHGYRGDPQAAGVARIILTASGGPFRRREVASGSRTSRRAKRARIPTGSWAARSASIPRR